VEVEVVGLKDVGIIDEPLVVADGSGKTVDDGMLGNGNRDGSLSKDCVAVRSRAVVALAMSSP
jgi:hypothetical protein